jgi:hypothetical protein
MMDQLISDEADRLALRIVAGLNEVVTDDDGGPQFGALITDVFGDDAAVPPGEIMLALGRRLLASYRAAYGAEGVRAALAAELLALAQR